MRDDYIDAHFEVIREPRPPVHWQPERRRRTPLFRLVYGGVIVAVALYTLILGLAGADLDTRDAVASDAARQPSAVALP